MYEDYYPVVVQAVAVEDFTVYAYYSDGSIRLTDIKPPLPRVAFSPSLPTLRSSRGV